MIRPILENKIASLLLLTTLLGALSTFVEFDQVRVVYWNGSTGLYKSWDFYFHFRYLIDFIFVLALLVNKRTWIDVNVIWCYFTCDLIGFGMYKYQGYPEPKMFTIGIFFVTLIVFFLLEIWRRRKL